MADINISKMQELKDVCAELNLISVYDTNCYSFQELYYKLANKLNEIIIEVKRFEGLVDAEIVKQTEILEELLNKGVADQVIIKLNEWLEDGTLAQIINETVFNALDTKVDTINKKTFDYVQKFVGDYKGVCIRAYNQGKLDSERMRNNFLTVANECGFNSVALTVNVYQQNVNSNNPFERVPVNNDEVERYLKFLQENNFRILFKPHVELETDPYVWRAEINPSDVDTWFSNYTTGMIEYAKLCEKYKVEMLSVGSEYKLLTEKYPSKWRELIKEIRKHYNGLLTYGANLNNSDRDEANNITFWNDLDVLGVDFYVYPFDEGTEEQYTKGFFHDRNHKNTNVLVDSLSNKWNKPILFTEYGKPATSETDDDRLNYVRALNNVFFTKDYNLGGFIWVFDNIETNWLEKDTYLKQLLKKNIPQKTRTNDGYFLTQKGYADNLFAKVISYDIGSTTYKDSVCDFNFITKGLTNNGVKQEWCNLKIRVSVHDNASSPYILCEIQDGTISKDNIGFKINDTKVEVFINVPNYSQVFFKKIDSPDSGLFDVYEYADLVTISDLTKATDRRNINYTGTQICKRIADDIILIADRIEVGLVDGVKSVEISLPTEVWEVFHVSTNVLTVNGGENNDIISNGLFIGENKIRISTKHVTGGNYTLTLSYLVLGRRG